MGYRSYHLKDVYEFMLEADQENLRFSRLASMGPKELSQYLLQLKASNPGLFGKTLVHLAIHPTTRAVLAEL